MRVAVTAILLAVATLVWRLLAFTGFTNDHYAHLGLAQQMLLGDRPVRDFVDPGWPLTYLISAGAWRLAGDAMAVEWAVTAVALAIAAACTSVAAHRLSGSLPIAVLVALTEVAIFPRTYAYPKLLSYAAGAVALLLMAAKPTATRVIAMAAVVAAAFLLRHDHGLYIGVSAAIAIGLASWPDGMGTAARRVGALTAATAVVLAPWMLFVALNGGLTAYFDTALEFARGEANASNLRSWPRFERIPGRAILGLAPPSRPLAQVEWTADTTDAVRGSLEARYGLELAREGDDSFFYEARNTSDENLAALDDDPHVAGTTGLGRVRRPFWREIAASMSPFRLAPALHSADNADAWLFWLFWALPGVCSVVLAVRGFWGAAWGTQRGTAKGAERWPGERAAMAALIVLAVAVNAGFLRDVLRTRFSDAIVLPGLLSAWLLGGIWTHPWQRRLAQTATRTASIALLVVTSAAIATVADLPERFSRTGIPEGLTAVRARASAVSDLLSRPHRQDVAPPSYVSAALMPFFAYVDRCSSVDDRILVTGEFPDVVVLARRRFASDGVVMGAWYSSATHQDQTLAKMQEQPPLFVVYIDQRPFRTRFPRINAYLAESFQPLATLTSDAGESIPVLVSRNRTAGRMDGTTEWPCFR